LLGQERRSRRCLTPRQLANDRRCVGPRRQRRDQQLDLALGFVASRVKDLDVVLG
jgi:hypothetical protein